MDNFPEILSIDDVMSYLRVSRSTVARMVKKGELKSFKQGQFRRFKKGWLIEYENKLIAASGQ
ncbi:excisionase family DNA binding protein [Paenibacillus sp. SORGH_AS306]|uniref:helix-turn-helix domain-containing protein n=1 Tax=unclassified Paenibacillus TaxID=185978 RepID=UPI00277FC4A5|nr:MULTISPECIES: helix-turn-helix domain-containing protein [unclassified Paenibacillus]MDQ1233316.1 excisionase family DNA binding protein [Paenibacillus sp. SORGH_AS_0306]MDR6110358.1 excisionase family DNA binding protein [Paenibacillus sp. SORGH_AS_0338]